MDVNNPLKMLLIGIDPYPCDEWDEFDRVFDFLW